MSHIKNQILERRNMIMNNGRRIGLIMIITGATLWGLSGPMIQWLFQHTNVSSIDFLTIRLLLAGIFILSFLLIKKQNIFQIWKHLRYSIQLIIFSILGMLGAQYAFIETVHISNAVTATLFQFLGPVLITVYVAFEQRKFPASMQLFAIIAALIGTYFIITNGSIENIVLSKEAIIFGLLTAIGFAFYTLHPASLIKECGTTVVIGWGMLIGGIALLIYNRSFGWNQFSQTLTLKTFS